MPQQLPRPTDFPISEKDWENLPPNVQVAIAAHHKQMQHIRRQSRQLATIGFAIALVATLILLVFSVYTLRPYVRLVRLRSQPDQVVCAYREPMLYTVRPRDTLFGISLRYEVPVSVLASANVIRNINSINIGDELFIPDSVCVEPAVNTRIANEYATGTAEYLSATPTLLEEEYQATETRDAAQYFIRLTQDAVRWQTITAQDTPPDLTRTTATPSPVIDPIYLTATYIVGRATREAAQSLTATASH